MTKTEQNIYNAFQTIQSIGRVVSYQELFNTITWGLDNPDDVRNVIQLLEANGTLSRVVNTECSVCENYIWL